MGSCGLDLGSSGLAAATSSGQGSGDAATSPGLGSGDVATSPGQGSGDIATSPGQGSGDAATSPGQDCRDAPSSLCFLLLDIEPGVALTGGEENPLFPSGFGTAGTAPAGPDSRELILIPRSQKMSQTQGRCRELLQG